MSEKKCGFPYAHFEFDSLKFNFINCRRCENSALLGYDTTPSGLLNTLRAGDADLRF